MLETRQQRRKRERQAKKNTLREMPESVIVDTGIVTWADLQQEGWCEDPDDDEMLILVCEHGTTHASMTKGYLNIIGAPWKD